MPDQNELEIVGETVVSNHLLMRIGDIMVSFAQLEDLLRCLLARYLSESDETIRQIIGSNLSFTALRATIISLHIHTFGDGPSLETLRQIMARAGKIEEERNRIVHSTWGFYEETGTVARIKITARERRGYEISDEEYDEARLA